MAPDTPRGTPGGVAGSSLTHLFLGVAKKPYSLSLYLQQQGSHL